MDSNDKNKSNDELHKHKPASGIYKCEFCDKNFSSGKALGGHKRIHQLQPLRKEGGTSNNSNNGTMIKSSSNGKQKQRCHVCNKDFPSNKSLYGHMRSHPDRDWRGIHPPIPSNNNHCFEENDYDYDDDHAEFLSAIDALKKPVTFIDASISFLPPSCHNAAHTLVHMSRNKEENNTRHEDEIGESSQSGSRRIIRDFDLNEPPKSE